MKLQAIKLLLCGCALAISAEEVPAEVATAKGADEKVREKRQWFPGDFNPNLYGDFYPRTWWGNDYANYATIGGFGGRSGYPLFDDFRHPYDYMGQMLGNYNNLPDVIDTAPRSRDFPMPILAYMYGNTYMPPMTPSDPAMFQGSWQQYFQHMGMMPGNGFHVGPQGEFPQPNRPFVPSGGNSGSPFGGNSGRPFGNNPGGNFEVNSGSSFGGNYGSPFGNNPSGGIGANYGSSFGVNSGSPIGNNPSGGFEGNSGSSFGGNSDSLFGNNPNVGFGGNSGSSFGENSGSPSDNNPGSNFGSSSGSQFGAGSSSSNSSSSDPFESNSFEGSDSFGGSDSFVSAGSGGSFGSGSSFGSGNSFGTGASADPFGSDSFDSLGNSTNAFLSSNLVKKSTEKVAASPAVTAE